MPVVITQSLEPKKDWEEISENDPLFAGDIILQVYQLTPGSIYVQAVLVGQAERNIESDPNLHLIRSYYPYDNDPNMVAYEIEIAGIDKAYNAVSPLLIALIVLIGIGFGVFGTMQLAKTMKYNRDAVLATTPEGLAILKTEAETAAAKVQESTVTKMTISGVAVAVILAILYKSGILGK